MSDLFEVNQEPEQKTKKIILIAIAVLIFITIIIIGVMLFIYMNSEKKLRLFVDGVQKSTENNVVVVNEETGDMHFSIERMASLLGYEFYNGEYKQATEDRDKCYIRNANELVSFTLNSNIMYKTLLSDDTVYDSYTLKEAVKDINGKLYITYEALEKAFNSKVYYNQETKVLTIYTLPNLITRYQTEVVQYGYDELAEDFKNTKAILYDMLVVKKNDLYGVINLEGESIIGTKYDNIEFAENTQEFFITGEGKKGILTSDGSRKIGLNYDTIEVLDNDFKLYLVTNGGKYGVLDKDGNVLIHLDYDYIGIRDVKLFPSNDIKNPYLLHDNCIPVLQNNKWGFFDITGRQITSITYDSIGYIASTSRVHTESNVLIVPNTVGVEGIVVSRNGRYGLINSFGEPILPDAYTRIYMETSNGVDTYYVEYNSQIRKLSDILQENSQYVSGNTVTVPIEGSTTNTNSTTTGNTVTTQTDNNV